MVLVVVLQSGCASLTTPLPDLSDLPARAELTAVPFYPQLEFQCGPAALATVLSHAGIEATPEQLRPQVYLPGREGSLQTELIAATRRYERVPYVLPNPDLRSVLAEVAAGHPVLVLQNNGLSWLPVWHYAVVVGFDVPARELILRSGTTSRLLLSMETFQRTWERGRRWALVVTGNDEIPATADERSYLQAVAALEQVGKQEAAWHGYSAAMRRWPDSIVAMFGLANTTAALQRYEHAVPLYRTLLDRAPDYAAAWNNLAHVLMELGQYDAALDAIGQAIRLGGAMLPAAETTRAEIEVRKQQK